MAEAPLFVLVLVCDYFSILTDSGVTKKKTSSKAIGSNLMKVIIAAGGTGGHIYPDISVGKALEVLRLDAEDHFLGATKGLQNKI